MKKLFIYLIILFFVFCKPVLAIDFILVILLDHVSYSVIEDSIEKSNNAIKFSEFASFKQPQKLTSVNHQEYYDAYLANRVIDCPNKTVENLTMVFTLKKQHGTFLDKKTTNFPIKSIEPRTIEEHVYNNYCNTSSNPGEISTHKICSTHLDLNKEVRAWSKLYNAKAINIDYSDTKIVTKTLPDDIQYKTTVQCATITYQNL
jgi:hypothetical protein